MPFSCAQDLYLADHYARLQIIFYILICSVTEIVLPGYAGASSDDALSSGGEFYENENFEFLRPSEEVMLKSIPIVPTQQACT